MKKSAFTLIEMIIVILVFGTGILAVLYGIVQTLANQDRANTQITSSFLAREGIELMYNLRDSNYRKKLPRNCIFKPIKRNSNETADDVCKDGEGFTGGSVFKIAIDPNKYLTGEHTKQSDLPTDFDALFAEFQLYYHTGTYPNTTFTGFRYSHDNNGTPLRFARYVLLKPVVDEGNTVLPQDKILKIESHVLYKKGGLTGERVMESFIGNYEI